MDNRYYDNLINEMKPFFDENGFVCRDDGSFRSETKSVAIEYSEERQMYLLKIADFADNTVGEYTEISAWLFDDSQNAKDAESVGVDFTATLRENLGIKLKRAKITDVDLPSADKNGSLTVSGFTKKVLDVYPQYKDDYKEHIAKYGNFLYLNFFSETLVPQICTVLKENNKKTNKKLFELLENAYISGDKETVNVVVAVMAAAVYTDNNLKDAALQLVAENAHFHNVLAAFIPTFATKKKLIKALVKE